MLLIAGLLIIAGVLFRKWYLAKPRVYKVSETTAAKTTLTVIEHNPRFETASIELSLHGKGVSEKQTIGVEFLNKNGEFDRKNLAELEIDDIVSSFDAEKMLSSIAFEKRDLMRGIRQLNIQLYRFRFVVVDENKAIVKSPVFAFSSKYMLFRPDSGRYN